MRYLVVVLIVFIVGYAVVHRTRALGKSRQTVSPYSGRDIKDLREELSAKEHLLASIKNTMETGNVPTCGRATDLKFSEEGYASVRNLEAEVAALRKEIAHRRR